MAGMAGAFAGRGGGVRSRVLRVLACAAVLAVVGGADRASAQAVQKAGDGGGVAAVAYFPMMGSVNLEAVRGLKAKDVVVQLTINGGERRSTKPREDGTFLMQDVAPGVHVLETFAPSVRFPRLRVEMSARHNGKIRVSYVENHRNYLPLPLLINPVGGVVYFEPRPQFFSLATLYRNPMMLMMGFSALLLFAMPKMMDQLDPEERAELEEKMKNQPSLTDLLSGKGLGGGGGDDEDDASTSSSRKKAQ